MYSPFHSTFTGIQYKKRMFDVRCKGTENELGDCSYKTYAACRYYDMASVVCSKCKSQFFFLIFLFRLLRRAYNVKLKDQIF